MARYGCLLSSHFILTVITPIILLVVCSSHSTYCFYTHCFCWLSCHCFCRPLLTVFLSAIFSLFLSAIFKAFHCFVSCSSQFLLAIFSLFLSAILSLLLSVVFLFLSAILLAVLVGCSSHPFFSFSTSFFVAASTFFPDSRFPITH